MAAAGRWQSQSAGVTTKWPPKEQEGKENTCQIPRTGENSNPISVILVSSGSRGNKLLFRYPFQRYQEPCSSKTENTRSCYALDATGNHIDDLDGDSKFSDVILATILATKSDMCSKKFELKIDNVRFVGHPTLLQHAVCQANADPSIISCLHNLSRRIAIVLQHEERRCQYLTREAKLILAIQDEVSAMSESPQSPFHHILPKCKLARDLKEVYDSLCTTGLVRLHINNWLEVSFCLPHKIHCVGTDFIPPDAIETSLKCIRPYHALLLLEDEKNLLNDLPLDCSPALVRIIKSSSAVKNLQQLAQDADLALLQVFQLAAHLVYWGKAIIIYPLCENNIYMLSPNANLGLYSPLAEQFSLQFPLHDLPSVLAKFSLPLSLSEFKNPLSPPGLETSLIQMVIWMLQHRLLIQIHTYVCLIVPPSEDSSLSKDEDTPFAARVGGRSLSTPNALSFGSPTSSDDMTLTSPSMDNSSAELLPGGDSPISKRATENLLASLSQNEKEAILSVSASQNQEDLKMFARCIYPTKMSRFPAKKPRMQLLEDTHLCVTESNEKGDIDNKQDSSTSQYFQNRNRLKSDFYEQTCTALAKTLLGKILVRKMPDGTELRGRIVETESYLGGADDASHSRGGKRTERNMAMYMKPGTLYVYQIYGLYFCMNISSLGDGAAVLLRSLEPLKGFHCMQTFRSILRNEHSKPLKDKDLCNGPAKLCQAMSIDKTFDKKDLTTDHMIWLETGLEPEIPEEDIVSCSRIGIGNVGVWTHKPLRFYIRGSKYVSVCDKTAKA
uniref:GATOR complex protein NPRL3 n=1 Tax=Leptobrachium leishanense TaxID=445787 RepID=A0A8C5Q3R1_9ANUR